MPARLRQRGLAASLAVSLCLPSAGRFCRLRLILHAARRSRFTVVLFGKPEGLPQGMRPCRADEAEQAGTSCPMEATLNSNFLPP
jgi:hypothetical protein